MELVDVADFNNLSASLEIMKVEAFKFGEPLTDNADGNPERNFNLI